MKNNIAKDAATLTVAKIATTLIALVSAMLLSRLRTLEEYGTYSEILMVVSLAVSVFMIGLPSSINYFLARADTAEEKWRFLSVYYTLSTLLCVVMGAVLAVAVPLIVDYFDNQLIKNFTYVLVLLPWTKVVIGSISNVLVVYGQTAKLTLINIVNASVSLVAILITQLFKWSFREYMALFVCGESFVMLWVYRIVWYIEKPLKPLLSKDLLKKILAFSIPVGLASVIGTLSIEIDKFMIGFFFDTESVAIYTNAGKELPFAIFASSLTAVLLPQMARRLKSGENEEAIVLWKKSVELSYIVICFCVTACIVFAPQIMTILYSEKYLPGIAIFRIYSLVLLLRITYYGIILNSLGKTKFIFYCSLLSLFLNAFLNYFLYRTMGFVGPAIATFLSILLVAMLQLFATSRNISMPFVQIFPWKELFKNSCENLIWGLFASFCIYKLNIGTSIRDIIFCVCFGILILLTYVICKKKRVVYLWKGLNS